MRRKLTRSIKNESGGAAIEYIIISTFAALVSISAITFIGKVFNERMQAMSKKLGAKADALELDDFGLDEGN